jgi:outer membrane beta-barrel protein
MQRLVRLGLTPLALLAMLTAEETAFALQGGEDPALLPVLVDKRYGAGGRHQLSLVFSTPMVTKFVESTGAYLAYDLNFSDVIGVEIGGGFFKSGESSIMKEVRDNFPGQEPPLSDLYQMQWVAQVDFVLVPIYGKISFASEVDPSFDLFILAGGGVAGVRRLFLDSSGAENFDSKIAPAFNAGFGFRFYFNRLLALRLEIRDFVYPEQAPDNSGFTFNLQFHGGLQLAFGGEE